MKPQRFILFFLSFTLALCSLSYELILAQILSATLGGTLLRHCTVIGLFTLSMGLGSLAFGRAKNMNPMITLFRIELVLSFLGLASPLFIIFLEPTRIALGQPLGFEFVYYLPVILIGWFSGYELPLLIEVCRTERDQLQTLAFDYIGMFFGSLFVPLVLYANFGPFVGSLWMSLLNLFAASLLLPTFRSTQLVRNSSVLFALFIATAFFISSESVWLPWVWQWYIS